MIRNEISKIVKSPYMWGVLLFCILINCGILCFENTEDFSSSQYKKVWQQFLSEEKNLQDEIASSKDKAEKYKQNEMTDKEKLYVRFAKELEAVSTYNDYRQRIQENAKKITLFSTFTEGGFAEKNIEKTAAHFKKMKMVKVVAEPSLGIEKMFSTVTGIVVLFFVLYLGYLLFVRENETGIAKLLYVTRFGKRKLFFAKLAAHIWGTAVAALIFYGCNYVILRERYGIGDLSRSIQSVLAYRSCGSELSVGQFLILSMIILIFIMTALAIFIDCICILGKRALISIMIFFFCIIGCVLVYVQIPMNSNLVNDNKSKTIIFTCNNDLKKILNSDTDGLLTYEYIANHMGSCDEDMPVLADNIIRVDMTGQITVSAALYLHATGAEKYREIIDKLIAASLSKDREHKYIVDLLSGIWGEDYKSHAEELKQESDNFRRIYKRVYVNDII